MKRGTPLLGIAMALLLALLAVARADPPPVTTYPAPWNPVGSTVSLSVSNSSSRVQLGWVGVSPNAPQSAYVCNTGSVTAYVVLGGSSVVATTSGFPISSGACNSLAINGATNIAGITASSTTSLTISAGSGSASTSGGPGGGGGSWMLKNASNAIYPDFYNYTLSAPHVSTNAALAAKANATYPGGLWRDHYATGGTADGPLFFQPQSGTCAANSWVNDGGNCVNSTSGDGNSWLALHQNGIFNVREFGAKGDNSTDDTAAIQAAINAASSTTPGIYPDYLISPSGNYCISTAGGLSATAPDLWLVSYGQANWKICGSNDSNLLSMNGTRERLIGIALAGYNSPSVSAGHNALTIGSSCVECVIESPTIAYGYRAISNAAADAVIRYTKALYAYGPSVALTTAGAFWIRDKFDQNYPTNTPPSGHPSVSEWAATTGYGANALVSVGTGAWLLQQTSGASCTSGSTKPVVAPYGTTITEGGGSTCTWQLAAPWGVFYAGLELQSGAAPTFVDKLDVTGSYQYSVELDNNNGGSGPQLTTLRDVNLGQPLNAGVAASNGSGLAIEGGSATNCVLSNCAGVVITSNWTATSHIGDGFTAYGNPLGVYVAGGTGLVMDGAFIYGSSISAFYADSGVQKFTVANSDLGASATWGANAVAITVANAGSDVYNLTNNIITGATTGISNSATGTHHTIFGNN